MMFFFIYFVFFMLDLYVIIFILKFLVLWFKKKEMDDVSFCNVVNFGFVCLFFGFYVLMDMIYLLLIYYLIKVLICISVYCMGYFYFFFV